jgi:hypothetical protein
VLIAGFSLLVGCPDQAQNPPPSLPAVGGQVSLIRIPDGGGTVEAYDPASLTDPIWTSRTEVPRMRAVLGINPETRLLLAIDTARNLLAIDLESRSVRLQAAGVESAVMAADGSVFVVGAGHRVTRYQAGFPTVYRTPLPSAPTFHAGSLGDRYIAVFGSAPRRLMIMSSDRQLNATDIADGEPAATYWTDLIAVPGDDRITLYQTEDPFESRTVRPNTPARHLVFSPSGHRIYVAHDDASIEIFDRYSLERLQTVELPGKPSRLRTDGSGRWLLAQPGSGDSAWIVDLATTRLAATVASEWSDDLPTVAGSSTLLTRRDGDLVAADLAEPNQPEIGRIGGGGADHWLVTNWLPRDRVGRALAAAESILVAQDSLLVADSQAVGASDRLYLQVSMSQNPDWSRELAKQLTTAGYPARVLNPTSSDEGYRVVVGPFADRDAAAEAGRKLGRPYFVLTNPPIKQ